MGVHGAYRPLRLTTFSGLPDGLAKSAMASDEVLDPRMAVGLVIFPSCLYSGIFTSRFSTIACVC